MGEPGNGDGTRPGIALPLTGDDPATSSTRATAASGARPGALPPTGADQAVPVMALIEALGGAALILASRTRRR